MPPRLPISPRKRRTREHVLADLAVNHVERHALQCGFTVERVVHDYGIDLFLSTYDRMGWTESGVILLQLKATDRPKPRAGGEALAVRIARADIRSWLGEPLPVILILFNAKAEIAYWLYVQAYFEGQPTPAPTESGGDVTLRIPRDNVLNRSAVKSFARFRDQILEQIEGEVIYRV